MEYENEEAPRLALNVNDEAIDSFCLTNIVQDLYCELNNPLCRHRIPTLQLKAIEETPFKQELDDIAKEIASLLEDKDLPDTAMQIEEYGYTEIVTYRMAKVMNFTTSIKEESPENTEMNDTDLPRAIPNYGKLLQLNQGREHRKIHSQFSSTIMCYFDDTTLAPLVADRSRCFQLVIPSCFIDIGGQSYGDLAGAENSHGYRLTLNGVAEACYKLHRLYLFLLTTETGLRLCLDGVLKGESVKGSDGHVRKPDQVDTPNPAITLASLPISGESRSHQFSISEPGKPPQTFPRVQIFQQVVPKTETINRAIPSATDERYPFDSETELICTIFQINDPRISVSKGMKRLITLNEEQQQSAKKKSEPLKKKNKTSHNQDAEAMDLYNKQWELKCDPIEEHISDITTYFEMLRYVSTSSLEGMKNTYEWFNDDKIYNPCVLFNIKPLVADANPDAIQSLTRSVYLDRTFDYQAYTNNFGSFSNEHFHVHPQLNWKTQAVYTVTYDKDAKKFATMGYNSIRNDLVISFHSPNRVIRLPFNKRGLDYATFGVMYVPFWMNTGRDIVTRFDCELVTPICPFPKLSLSVAADFGAQLNEYKAVIKDRSYNRKHTPSLFVDHLRMQIFDVQSKENEVTSGRGIMNGTIYEKRKQAYDRLYNYLFYNTHSLPDTIKALMKYVKEESLKSGGGYSLLFPFYEKRGMNWEKYDVSMMSNYYIQKYKAVDIYDDVHMFHRFYLSVETGTVQTWLLRNGRQPSYYFMSTFATGKSWFLRELSTSMIKGTVEYMGAQSAQAMNTDVCNAGGSYFHDEIPASGDGLKAKLQQYEQLPDARKLESSADGQTKTRYSEGMTDKTVNQNQKQRKIVSIHKTVHAYVANVSLWLLIPSTLTRFLYARLIVSERSEAAKSMKKLVSAIEFTRKDHYRSLMHRKQLFCAFTGMLMRVGAIPYKQTLDLIHAHETVDKFFTILKAYVPFSHLLIDHARFKEDIVLQAAEGIMMERVWATLCSVETYIHYPPEDKKPPTRAMDIENFSLYEIFLLGQTGIFSVTFEDVIAALSFTEAYFEFWEAKATLFYLKDAFNSRDRKYHPEKSLCDHYNSDNLSAFHYTTRRRTNEEIDEYVLKWNQGCPATKKIEKDRLPSHAEYVNEYDLNYLHLTICNSRTQLTSKAVFGMLAKLIVNHGYASAHKIDVVDIHKFLVDMESVQMTVDYYPPYTVDKRSTYTNLEIEQKLINVFVVDNTSQDYFYVKISRQWFQQLILNTDGRLNFLASEHNELNGGFVSSIAELILPYLSYEGLEDKRICLPGMPYWSRVKKTKAYKLPENPTEADIAKKDGIEYPHVMKVLETTSPSVLKNRHANGQLPQGSFADVWTQLDINPCMTVQAKNEKGIHKVSFERQSPDPRFSLESVMLSLRIKRIERERYPTLRMSESEIEQLRESVLDKLDQQNELNYIECYSPDVLERKFAMTLDNNTLPYPQTLIDKENETHSMSQNKNMRKVFTNRDLYSIDDFV